MRQKYLALAAILVFVVTAFAMAQPKPRVAVMDFSEEFDQAWWVAGKLGEKASSLLNQALWDAQVFNLIERRELETVMQEHDLAASGAVTPQTAVELGKLLGADYMVLGAVTEFGWDKYEGRIPYSSRVLGGSGGELYNYNSAISVRIVNVETGEIEYMGRGNGSHRAFGVGFRGYEASAESSYDSIANETFQPAVKEIAQDIKQKASSLVTYQGFGRVADVADGEVYINRGSEDGVKVGDRFTVKRMGREIVDPDTGKVLSRRTKTAGTIEVISVEGPHFSICKIVEGEIQPKDMIEK